MKIISIVLVDDVIHPSEPLPTDAIKIIFNGTEYIIYEDSDELPVIE